MMPFFHSLAMLIAMAPLSVAPLSVAPLSVVAQAGDTTTLRTTVNGSSQEADSPREVLRLFEMDESVLRFFRDGLALSDDEMEPIYRLLYLLPRFDDLQRHRWRRVPESWQPVVDRPSSHRAQMYQVMGRVISVGRHSLPVEAARRFGYDEYYLLQISSTLDGRTLEVCSRQVPSNWPEDPRGQPVSCDALFLKVGEGGAGEEHLLLASDRIAWHPSQFDDERAVDRGRVLLGRSGMDVGRLPDVLQQQPLGSTDRECFYQMLWATRRMPESAIAGAAGEVGLPIIRILQEPTSEAGKVFRFRGTARRALRIRVEDDDIRQRYGIDHYFEVEIFVSLDQSLHLRDARDGETRGYTNFPVTVCCAELPKDMPQGDEIRQAIEVDAFFMKLWSYRSRFATGKADPSLPRRQISPLLIARIVRLDETPPPSNPWPGWMMTVMVVGTVAAAFLARSWYARADRPFQQWRRARGGGVHITVPSEPTDTDS